MPFFFFFFPHLKQNSKRSSLQRKKLPAVVSILQTMQMFMDVRQIMVSYLITELYESISRVRSQKSQRVFLPLEAFYTRAPDS